jgi:hypothetical protein
MELIDIFSNDLQGLSGGILICDKINGDRVILLGKSNVPKRADTYESFGGKTEKQDLTSLHTAIREFVEEFFNYKISTDLVNKIALNIRKLKLIKKQCELYGMAYLINFGGLNFIFQFILSEISSLKKYNVSNAFNLIGYISDRIIIEKPINGLNEIEKIEIFKLADILDKKVNLRLYTNKIIRMMLLNKKKS